MSAEADDLRYYYAETLGDSETLTANAGGATKNGSSLTPGRYLIQFHTVAGAALVWCRQGPFASVAAAAASPSTPFGVSAPPYPVFSLIVKPNQGLDGLSFITDAGTCDVTITKISRGKN